MSRIVFRYKSIKGRKIEKFNCCQVYLKNSESLGVGDLVKTNIGFEKPNKKWTTGVITSIDENTMWINGDIFFFTPWYWGDIIILIKSLMVNITKAKYGLSYEVNGDPVEFFNSFNNAKKRIEELLDKGDVDKNSIYIFEIINIKKVKRLVQFDLLKLNPAK